MIADLERLSVSKFIPGVGLVLSTKLSGRSRIPRTPEDHAAGAGDADSHYGPLNLEWEKEI